MDAYTFCKCFGIKPIYADSPILNYRSESPSFLLLKEKNVNNIIECCINRYLCMEMMNKDDDEAKLAAIVPIWGHP